MFASKARAYLSEAPFTCFPREQALPTNVRRGLAETNTLAYYERIAIWFNDNKKFYNICRQCYKTFYGHKTRAERPPTAPSSNRRKYKTWLENTPAYLPGALIIKLFTVLINYVV